MMLKCDKCGKWHASMAGYNRCHGGGRHRHRGPLGAKEVNRLRRIAREVVRETLDEASRSLKRLQDAASKLPPSRTT